MRALIAGARGEDGRCRAGDPRRSARRFSRTRSIRRSRPKRSCCRAKALIADRMEVVDPDAIHASREALREAIGAALQRRAARRASQRRRGGRRSVARGQGHPAAADGRARLARRGRRGASGGAGQGAVRRRRQHDRPPGRARRAGVARRAGAGGSARRLLRALPATIRWCSTNGSRCRRRRSAPDTVDQVLKLAQHPDFTMTNPNRLRSLAGTFGGNHWAFHSRRRPRLRLPRRHDHRRRQAQSAGRGAAGAAVRPLAAVRAEARRDDARRRWSGSSRRRACRRTCSSRRRRAWPDGAIVACGVYCRRMRGGDGRDDRQSRTNDKPLNVLGMPLTMLCEARETGGCMVIVRGGSAARAWDRRRIATTGTRPITSSTGEVDFEIDGEPVRSSQRRFQLSAARTPSTASRAHRNRAARVLIFAAPAHGSEFFHELNEEVRTPTGGSVRKFPQIGRAARHRVHAGAAAEPS